MRPHVWVTWNVREAAAKVKDLPFSPRDLSGVWGNNDLLLDTKNVPPMTPWGKQQYDATKAEETSAGLAISNSKDGMLICDPLGYRRSLCVNDGFEFVMLPDRVPQFFEWRHTWRTIWTDGRELPDDPPVARWHGYAVGRWEGDTFFPHSDQIRLVERYKRESYVTLDVTVTIDDPKTYTSPGEPAARSACVQGRRSRNISAFPQNRRTSTTDY